MQRRRFFASMGVIASMVSSRSALSASPAASASAATEPVVGTPTASTSATEALQYYLKRIADIDRAGPQVRSMLELNPDAMSIAGTLDAERKAGKVRGPLHGVTVAIKGNIATGDRMATNAGSLALDKISAKRDSFLVQRLREAGAVIVGKTNLSEWANIRSTRSTSGWSGVGGLTRNPYALDRTTSGSSSGSAAAVAAGLTAMAIGTETDGSITSPASINGLVGLKPTVGRVSRDGIIPISRTQDTAGPIVRTVRDAAVLMSVISAKDANDSATHDAPLPTDYLAALDANALRGARIGVARNYFSGHDEVDAQIERAIAQLKALGADVVDPVDLPKITYDNEELAVMLHEFKHDLAVWLDTFAPHARVRNLADVIAFNDAHRTTEMPYFGQELFLQAQALGGLDSDVYVKALATCRTASRDEGLDKVMADNHLDAIVAPTGGTAWLTDFINGDSGGGGFSTPAAVAGYPHLTVPAGLVRGLPVGLSFVGPAWSEARLLGFGYAFEQATQWRQEPKFMERTSVPVV
ncbi:amidase [Pararobbsia alpina]|uniref:amidase n=1 Tax=Pararobbsia alpina TaxID=621374 RepID=UPI0039A52236